MIDRKLLCEKYIIYLSDRYIDFNGATQTGLGKLNELLGIYGIEKQLYDNYSMGYQRVWGEEYCLCLQPSDNINKNQGVISAYGYKNTTKLSLDLKLSGGGDTLYILENYLSEILNTLAVNFINGENDAMNGNTYFDLVFNTQCYLESAKDSPNAYSTVTGVVARQDLSVSSLIQVQRI